VFSDRSGVLIFAYNPQGKFTVVVLPDRVTAEDMVACLEEEGWKVQPPTFDADIEFEDEDEDDDYELEDSELDDN